MPAASPPTPGIKPIAAYANACGDSGGKTPRINGTATSAAPTAAATKSSSRPEGVSASRGVSTTPTVGKGSNGFAPNGLLLSNSPYNRDAVNEPIIATAAR